MWPKLLRVGKLIIFIGICTFIAVLTAWSASTRDSFTHADVSTHATWSSEPTLVNVPPSTRHTSFRFGAAVDVYTELTTQRSSQNHEGDTDARATVVASLTESPSATDTVPLVHVWSKAAIGDYLWHHLLEGTTTPRDGGLWRDGNMTVGSGSTGGRTGRTRAQLWFRSGWSVRDSPALRALMPKHIVLVLNAHEPDLARKAQVIVYAFCTCLIVSASG